MAASQGSAIKPANRPNDSPLAEKARRLVRFDTGSSSDAEFARCVHAYMCGCDRMRNRAAVTKTTGVSSTIVASRLSTAVVTAATAKTCTSRRRGCPRDLLAIHAPQARNRPSSSQSCAITSTAARKPITGPSRCASATASWKGIAPVAMTMAAAGTAATASGQPRGLITAQASTASSAMTDSDSAPAVPSSAPSRQHADGSI